MKKNLPLITGAEAEALRARSGQYGFRCFVGIHKKVWFFWPTDGKYRIARNVTCIRCGELFDILLLSDERNAPARSTKGREKT